MEALRQQPICSFLGPLKVNPFCPGDESHPCKACSTQKYPPIPWQEVPAWSTPPRTYTHEAGSLREARATCYLPTLLEQTNTNPVASSDARD